MKKLFVYGDSISIQYGPFLKDMIAGKFDYDRISGEEEALKNLDIQTGANGGDSSRCLSYLTEMQKEGVVLGDVLLLNCGLHDLKTDPETKAKQVPIDLYEKNLNAILGITPKLAKKIIWVRTTPIHEPYSTSPKKGFHRYNDDVLAYNEVSDQVMTEAGIDMIDLHHFSSGFGMDALKDHAHFKPEIIRLQAAFIAGALLQLVK